MLWSISCSTNCCKLWLLWRNNFKGLFLIFVLTTGAFLSASLLFGSLLQTVWPIVYLNQIHDSTYRIAFHHICHCFEIPLGLNFSTVFQLLSGVWLSNPMDCSMPGFPVLHYLLEFVETHVHSVSDAIQPYHPLSTPSPFTTNVLNYNVSLWDFHLSVCICGRVHVCLI